MKTYLKVIAMLLGLVTLLGVVSCDKVTPEKNTDTTSASGQETLADSETEAVGLPELTLTEEGGVATVSTSRGLTYLAKNYSKVDGTTFTFNSGLEISFPEGIKGDFNRVKLCYEATAPMKVYIYYTVEGESAEDYFFLEATKTDFSGLISGYLDERQGAVLQRVVFNTCEEIDAELTLYSVETEVHPVYENNLYIENDRFKFGVRLSWGGAVTYYEDKEDGIKRLENMVNIHDTGRLIQQSFYGTYTNDEGYVSGYNSGNALWPYNPVQGGDKMNNGSERLIDVEVGENYIYILSQSLDWAWDNSLTSCYYENKYTLYDEYIRVDNVATDFSGWEHVTGGQEIPAVYLVSYFDTLCYYNGKKPWTGDEDGLKYVEDLGGWDESGSYFFGRDNTEVWATWINTKNNFGFGIYCPNVDKLIAIRHEYDGTLSPTGNPTTYVAPSSSIAMQAYKPIVYSYLITSGTPEYIREIFTENKDFADNASLDEDKFDQRVVLEEFDMTDMDFSDPKLADLFCGHRHATVSYSEAEKATCIKVEVPYDPYVFLDYTVNSDKVVSADEYNAVEIEYMIPETNQRDDYRTVLFLCAGTVKKPADGFTAGSSLIKDGEYHTISLNLPKDRWSGDVHKIRFDFFHSGEVGDVLFVKSIRFKKEETVKIAAVNDMTKKGNEAILTTPIDTQIAFDDAAGATKFATTTQNGDVSVEMVFSELGLSASTYKTLEIEYMLPKTNSCSNYNTLIYYCVGDMSG